MEELRNEADRAQREAFLPPSGSDGMSYFISQQQAVGEARMAGRLEQLLQQHVTTLAEEKMTE